MKNQIDNFLETFYSSLSSKPGLIPNFGNLKSLFESGALAVNTSEAEIPCIKTIETYLDEMQSLFGIHECLRLNVFTERETYRKVYTTGCLYFIESTYSKRYHNGTDFVDSVGINKMTVLDLNGTLKIISIVW